jgi:YggT family protein
MSPWTPLALSRVDVADYLQTLIYVYVALIFIRVILSYFRSIPYNRFLSAFVGFVNDVTDPYLNLFRRIIPPIRLGPAALDLTPIIATFVLLIVGGIVVNIVAG